MRRAAASLSRLSAAELKHLQIPELLAIWPRIQTAAIKSDKEWTSKGQSFVQMHISAHPELRPGWLPRNQTQAGLREDCRNAQLQAWTWGGCTILCRTIYRVSFLYAFCAFWFTLGQNYPTTDETRRPRCTALGNNQILVPNAKYRVSRYPKVFYWHICGM